MGFYLDEGGDERGEHVHGAADQVEERQRDEGLVGLEDVIRVGQDVDGERRQRHLADETQKKQDDAAVPTKVCERDGRTRNGAMVHRKEEPALR